MAYYHGSDPGDMEYIPDEDEMSDTPKSALMFVSNERLKEIVEAGRMWCGDRETQLLAAEVIRCRASLPPQAAPEKTAVGEGELPPLNVTKEDWDAARREGRGQFVTPIEADLACRERQLCEAIAQRDEAWEMLDLHLEQKAALNTDKEIFKARAEAAEAKLAALDVAKPEEIERLLIRVGSAAKCSLRLSGDRCNECEGAIEEFNQWRLRSLPSEPQSEIKE